MLQFLAAVAICAAQCVNPAPNQSTVQKVNMSCGLAPLPPLGCRVGGCVCDQTGRNCSWQMVCR